ncbi:glycosyltransferase family 2 protein [Sulfurimonas sp. C5]|uniref:glycosyltransferase family 2 protein n=1 Tax=Sulfurimonas sp. C5 TaxID=3036947 RepID=UPI002456D59D|nr:glycosyltransferase family 2 protein [Sulfurimonas sp. C5]MDH4945460.1 glycosyltransferase family 2 protein [Sulfurimonas sp. C5]
MKTVDISFITINYNSSDFTIKLIESIQKHTTISYEIIVVDNASEIKDYQSLHSFVSTQENIQLIQNRINSGFASGNMLGVNYASGNYYFFINNDTQLLNDAAKLLKEHLDLHQNIALATAQVNDENGNYSSSHKIFPSLIKEFFGNTVARKINKFPSNKITLEKPTAVEVISGSCMFFRASVFCEIGGFDTNFFLYCEEEDISKRIWLHNNEVHFLPTAKIIHHSGGSTDKSLAILKEYYISYKHLIFKHFGLIKGNLLMFLVTFKLLRRSFKNKNGVKLFIFALRGFPKKESLRYKQTIKN